MPRRAHRLALIAAAFVPVTAAAQRTTTALPIGSVAEDRARLAQLAGASTDGFLLREGWQVASTDDAVRVVLPELRVVYNSALVTPRNEGALWAGRGTNVLVRGGLTVARGRVRLTLLPELTRSANAPVEVPAAREDAWSAYASPWRTATMPADLPLRFGDAPIVALHPGQSALTFAFDRVAVGIASGNLWVGPALRNALVLGDHAGGIPHAFVRTPRPLQSPLGAVEARLLVGGLTESLYFDTLPSNDLRAVNGLIATLAPAKLPGLTVGVARLIVTPVDGGGALAGRALDALTVWNGDDQHDQMSSLFARWVAPEGGLEFWTEYARSRLPATLREAATTPNADMGWTAGAQWAVPRDDGALRLQLEFTDVAQSRVAPDRAPRDWGTGRNAIQGFTQRGRMLGAATGPGSTHAWLAVDRVREAWSLGGFVARTRWENDAFYREPRANFFAHDASVFIGTRGQWRHDRGDVGASLSFERRYNYLFENGTINPGNRGQRTVDNVQLTLSLTPRGR